MATFDLPELPDTRVSPQLMLGAASPLWAYFGAAAAGGVAYWWMTRWTQPVNLEALFGGLSKAAALPVAVTEAVVEAAVETVEAVEASADTLLATPVGGEAAPISPLVEALAAPEPEPTIEPEPEAIVEAAAEPVVEAAPEPMVEATADPIPEPVGKPRIRKGLPANGLEA